MTRADIESDYNVVDGVMRSPGKFEGEPVWAPAIYEKTLNGCSEILDYPDDTRIDIVEIDADFRSEFGIDAGTVAVGCEASNSGFVYCRPLTADRLAGYRKEHADICAAQERADQRNADRVDGYDRDDLGLSPDF